MEKKTYLETLPRELITTMSLRYLDLPIGEIILLWLNNKLSIDEIEDSIEYFHDRARRLGLPYVPPPNIRPPLYVQAATRLPQDFKDYLKQLEILYERYPGLPEINFDNPEVGSAKRVMEYVLSWEMKREEEKGNLKERVFIIVPSRVWDYISDRIDEILMAVGIVPQAHVLMGQADYFRGEFISTLEDTGFVARSYPEAILKIFDFLRRKYPSIAEVFINKLSISTLAYSWDPTQSKEEFIQRFIKNLLYLVSGREIPSSPLYMIHEISLI